MRLLPVIATLLLLPQAPSAATPADFLTLPPGFRAEVLVDSVPNARGMALAPDGTLYVGSRSGGKVYAVRDALKGSPRVMVLAEGLNMPNGVAYRDGSLFVADAKQLLRLPGVDRASAAVTPEPVGAPFPYKNALHAWKYLAFGPDGWLYVPVGAPCNVCQETDFGVILRIKPDGSAREVIARGVRNPVGFDWHPGTGEFWFTDNGRDMLGDELPPDELNRVASPGLDFGFPYCHAGTVADPQFGTAGRCSDAAAPAQLLAPHAAALAVRFYTGSMFPPEYRGQAFIAEHGSWNRSRAAGKTGFRITLVRLVDGRPVAYEPFATGFLAGDEVRGRPVDLLVAPDGALLVSDDQRGVIYRISYVAPAAAKAS
jgi:glucose/arabinose dehydrogenase